MNKLMIVIACTLLGAACSGGEKTEVAAKTPVRATSGPGGVQNLEVKVGADFEPNAFEVEKGKPVRISFVRGADPSCGDEVVFTELGIRRKIPPQATTVVDLTPQQSGKLHFTCGMNMMKGEVIVR